MVFYLIFSFLFVILSSGVCVGLIPGRILLFFGGFLFFFIFFSLDYMTWIVSFQFHMNDLGQNFLSVCFRFLKSSVKVASLFLLVFLQVLAGIPIF